MKNILIITGAIGFTLLAISFVKDNLKLINVNISNVDSTVDKQINLIKSQYKEIEANLKSYKKTVSNIEEEESAEGTEVTKYSDGKIVKKITESTMGEDGKLLENYYFYEGKLIFYYAVESKYNIPLNAIGNTQNIKVTNKIEKRYYFKDGTIIKYITTPSINISSRMLSKIAQDIQNELKTILH